MTNNERRSSEERITRWKDVANLGLPASLASVQNGGLVVCTGCRLPEIVLRDCVFVCDNSRCVNRLPTRGPSYEGDDQKGVDPKNPHCHCGVASRKRTTRRGIEVEECAALRCDFYGEGEKPKLNIEFAQYSPSLSTSNHHSGQTTPSSSSSFHRTDSSGSLFPRYGRGLGQITPGNVTPQDSLSRSSSMTSFGTLLQTPSLTMTSSKTEEEADEGLELDPPPELNYRFSLPMTPSKPDEEADEGPEFDRHWY